MQVETKEEERGVFTKHLALKGAANAQVEVAWPVGGWVCVSTDGKGLLSACRLACDRCWV